jgi:hypothetical protein
MEPTWQVESSGPYTTLVVKRRSRIATQQDLHRNEAGRIVWFESRDDAQKVADKLNEQEKVTL